jgi:FG-GAP repeat
VCSYASDQGHATPLSTLPLVAQSRIIDALTRDLTWQQRAELTAKNGGSTDEFGWSVAISGDTVVVGAQGANHVQGAAYVFVKPKTGWKNMTQTAKLTASEGTTDFGISVAIDGNTILVGALNSPSGGYIFVKPVRGWKTGTETVKLPNVTSCGGVAIVGGTAVCSTLSAFVYVRPKTGWKAIKSYAAELRVSDCSVDCLSGPIAISHDHSTVVASGWMGSDSAYVFVRPESGWNTPSKVIAQAAELKPSDGSYADGFGFSISISRNTVAAGAPLAMNGEQTTGAVYVFVKPAGGWTNMDQTAKLFPSNQSYYCGFGDSVALEGSTLAVGVSLGDYPNGAVYVYFKPPGGWTSTGTDNAMFAASDGQGLNYFGWSLAITGETILVGSQQPGAAYVFKP